MVPILPIWVKKISVHSPTLNLEKGITFRKLQATHDTALVWGALAFTLRVTRFFGTAPSSFQRGRSCWRVSVSPAMCLYSYVFIVVLNIIIFAALVRDASAPSVDSIRMRSQTNTMIWVLDLVIVTIISVYGIASAPSRMKQLIAYLNEINTIFSNLNRDYIMKKPEKLRCWFIVLYALGVLAVCANDIATYEFDTIKSHASLTTFWMYAFYYIEVLILWLLELQFILSAVLSHTAFRCVNEELTALIIDVDMKTTPNHKRVALLNRGIFPGNYDVSIPPYAVNVIVDSVAMLDKYSYLHSLSQCWSKKIRHLSLAYNATCDAVRRIDNSNGVLLLLLLLSFLIHMVVTPYYLITYIFGKRNEFLLQVFWCIFHTSKMVMIVEPGHMMQQEIARTQQLIGQLMNRASSPTDLMMEELNLFHKQVTLNPVVFSPMGFCTLNRPLIATILGVVTTYLVILVQFMF